MLRVQRCSMRAVWLCLLLAHVVSAITGPRIENEYDRRRQAAAALGHPGFAEHQTRFGLSSPLQTFQSPPNLLSSPAPPPIQFPHQAFPQQTPLQQPYVPQFNTLLPTQSLPNIQNNVPNNNFHFNQQPNGQILQNPYTPQQNFRPSPQTQGILPQAPPTLSTFQNNIPQQNVPTYSQPIQSHTLNLGQQRPTTASFLPTVTSSHNQPIFSNPNPITIQAAPNLAPQNLAPQNVAPQNVLPQNVVPQTLNYNQAQIPFQPTLGQAPVLSNDQNAQIQEYYEQQSKENLEKIKELQERARIIQKHQEFVQKQQQKQQEKVEKLHEEFISKQATKTVPIYSTTESSNNFYNRNQERRRPIQPYETDLFRKAIEMYEKEHPTTTTSTTTTTTTTTTTPPPPTSTTSRFRSRSKPRSRQPPQDRNKQQLYNDIKNLLQESETKGFDDNLRAKSAELLQKPDILKQLKVALAENPDDFNEKNFSSREINLNGQKFEVIRTTNPNLIPKGAISAEDSNFAKIMAQAQAQLQSQESRGKESRVSIEDLTKGVLPPGANFELVRQAENGKLEEVKTAEIQNKKKVTFVFLEEQDDGSFKVKGVKANGQQTEEGPEVESILNKIKKGEIQLPGPGRISNGIPTASSTTASPVTETPDYITASSHIPPSTYVTATNVGTSGHTNPIFVTTPSPSPSYNIIRTSQPQTQSYTPSPSYNNLRTTQPQTPTYTPSPPPVSSTERYVFKSSTPVYDYSSSNRNSIRQEVRNTFPSPVYSTIATTPSYRSQAKDIVVIGSSTAAPTIDSGSVHSNIVSQSTPGLIDILKENGLFATAKYLKQSGLDTILNETGPYTIFAPTDKAFRTLLVQLGGPDKAEEKFRDNPRLLSGLLLHHVIPGAFDIGSLQDEMTGVSLAGTQLRVNQYDMHDVEWNEVKVTTINGARVLDDKKDIHIPQGIAHAVDRVMFPLPVGDLVQTLQADRDRRFTVFLKAIHASGFEKTLAESKTYTVFAPTDAAFARLSPIELSRYTDASAARALVARHVLPGTLYSAGMRYYQLRTSMDDDKPLTLQKNSGRIKVNNAQVVTHNIPATNGVIHAVDTLL